MFENNAKELEAKVEASARAQGDLRAALMVKDKVLEDREKVRMQDVKSLGRHLSRESDLACHRATAKQGITINNIYGSNVRLATMY